MYAWCLYNKNDMNQFCGEAFNELKMGWVYEQG